MYIGDSGVSGFHHLIKEAVDNAIDEFLDGHVTRISVHLDLQNNVIRVKDNGRGIPVEIHPDIGISTLTGIFTQLHGGSKFGKGAYTSAIVGLHGVGIKATCALSEVLQVWTVQNRKVYTQKFERGIPAYDVKRAKQKLTKGTAVVFRPDPEVFGDIKINPKRVRKWLRDSAYLCPGLEMSFKVDDKETEIFHAENGLEDLCSLLTKNEDLLHDPIVFRHKEFDMVLVWANVEGEHWKSWVNVSSTPEHGTHVNGVKKAVQTVFSEYAGKKVPGEDLRDGLIGFVHAHVLEPKFRGQAKVRLENVEITDSVCKITETVLRRFLAENSVVAKGIIDRAKQIGDARKKFRTEQKAIKGTRVKSGAKGILPHKLVECPDASPEQRELFIVEGDSASGTVVDARVTMKRKGSKKTVHFQEVYSLRGKLLNVARQDGLEAAMKNKEVEGLVKTLGTGIGPSFNLSKFRQNKIFILTDADPDGRHIRSLLIVLFAKFFPQFIDEGMLYIVRNPLFMGVTSTERVYGDSVEEIQKKLKNKKCRITRFKGLGEMDAIDMRMSLDPTTRDVIQLNWDEENDRELVLNYMGPDSEIRKEILGVVE